MLEFLSLISFFNLSNFYFLHIVNIVYSYLPNFMVEIKQANEIKILKELNKNARISLSELSKKTGLARQTIAKTIKNIERKNKIWGYTTIFDPSLIGLKPFVLLGKIDLTINQEQFLKKATSPKFIDDNLTRFGLTTSMFLHGKENLLGILWAKDIKEANKTVNYYIATLKPNIKEVNILDVVSIFRFNGISNPKMIEEWTSLIF